MDDVDLMCMQCGGYVDDVDPQCGVSTCPHLHIRQIGLPCPISDRLTQCISKPHCYNANCPEVHLFLIHPNSELYLIPTFYSVHAYCGLLF